MKCFALSLLAFAAASSGFAQQASTIASGSAPAAISADAPDLLSEQLGKGDLVGVSVYDAPELTRSARIDSDGNIRLPMVQQRIRAAGLLPTQLENAISTALVNENIMVNPIVTVSVVEYHSRPITVVGAVRSPTIFQATGPVTLLDAITRAGGISDNAGSEILISRHPPSDPSVVLTDRILVHSLMNGADQAANPFLQGGETIRVPEAGRVFVVGDVKRPGPFQISDNSESSILKALSIAGGLDSFASHTAYIYRIDGSNGQKSEIPVNIHKIMARKSPDVPLFANDMLYVPSSSGMRTSAKTLEIAGTIGLGMAALLLYTLR